MSHKIKFSLLQTDLVWEDELANLNKFDAILKHIDPDTDVIVLPEMFATGFTMNIKNFAKPVGKQVFEWLKLKAAKLQKVMVGSVLTEFEGRYYNRMYWMPPDGRYTYYDKKHLFQMGGEHKIMTAGKTRTIVKYKSWRFLLQICYDLRFPCWARNQYDSENDQFAYDGIIFVANWPEKRKYAYENLLKARAIENQSYVLWVNRIGKDGHNNAHSGDTKIIDPHGKILTFAPSFQEKNLTFELDKKTLQNARNAFKVGLDWDSCENI